MSIRSSFDDTYNSFVNGNLKQFVAQFNELDRKADFIDYISVHLNQPELVLEMMKSYFNISSR